MLKSSHRESHPKKKDYRWKRCRRKVKGPREEAAFRAEQQCLEKLHQAEAEDELEIFYFDESGFTLMPVVPYAWQPRGETVAIPCSPSQRLNVLGFMSLANQSWFHTVTGQVGSAQVIEALDGFVGQLPDDGKLRLVVLDQASIHTSKAIQACEDKWLAQRVGLHLLPPYSPELNPIEILWRKIKYEWLPLKAYLSFAQLKTELQNVLDLFGSKYRITFG